MKMEDGREEEARKLPTHHLVGVQQHGLNVCHGPAKRLLNSHCQDTTTGQAGTPRHAQRLFLVHHPSSRSTNSLAQPELGGQLDSSAPRLTAGPLRPPPSIHVRGADPPGSCVLLRPPGRVTAPGMTMDTIVVRERFQWPREADAGWGDSSVPSPGSSSAGGPCEVISSCQGWGETSGGNKALRRTAYCGCCVLDQCRYEILIADPSGRNSQHSHVRWREGGWLCRARARSCGEHNTEAAERAKATGKRDLNIVIESWNLEGNRVGAA